jgi:hypothetical protein
MLRWIVAAGAALLVAGCGSDGTPAAPRPPAANPGSGSTGGDCPLTVDELKAATSIAWEQEEAKKDHPLVLMESVKVTACIYTAPEQKDQYGDPLVVRVDVVSPKDADQVRERFRASCTDYRGAERAGGGGTICEREGRIVEGYIGNLNVVMIVNADKSTAANLTPSFEKVLAAAG